MSIIDSSSPMRNFQSELNKIYRGENAQKVNLLLFTNLLEETMAYQDEDELLRLIYISIDINCRGYLLFEDLKSVVKQVLPSCKPHIISQMFQDADIDRDGKVSYSDYLHFMKTHNPNSSSSS
eukprot:Sdes_comp18580_c0_seq3m8698